MLTCLQMTTFFNPPPLLLYCCQVQIVINESDVNLSGYKTRRGVHREL